VHVTPHVAASSALYNVWAVGGPSTMNIGVAGGAMPARPPSPTGIAVAQVSDLGPNVSGQLNPAIVQRVVHGQFGAFRSCYQKGLAGNPNLSGVVSLSFDIDATGAVTSITSSSSLADPGVAACVQARVGALVFPQADDGKPAHVTYPIGFHTAQS
jgi:hypothetical protein